MKSAFNMLHKYSFVLLAILTVVVGERPLITLSDGTLKGIVMKSAKGREFQAFRAIPYAKPPIGELRFKPPQPAEPWDGVLDASQDGPACPQFDLFFMKKKTGQEDCLILNVYTPNDVSKGDKVEKLPVMVFIHGGAFMIGSSHSFLCSPVKLMDKDIVLVSFNYRLGALGFLSTGDEESPGNYGLYDQVEALKWVQKNIAHFGGDREKVTIFGVSAGGGSVSHLVISPKAKGLFQAAIMQSGTSLNPWAVAKDPKKWAKALAIKLGCSAKTSKTIVDCIKTKSADEILLAQQHVKIIPFSITFLPVVENTPQGFLPQHPLNILKSKNYNKVPTITGVTRDEGAFHFVYYESMFDFYSPDFFKTDFVEVSPTTHLENNIIQATEEVVKHYFKNVDRSDKQEIRKALIKLFSDGFFTAGAERMVQQLSESGFPNYAYMLTHRGNTSFTELFGVKEDYGVSHGDDQQYIFGTLTKKELKGDDEEVSEIILNLLTNFAKFHDPTPPGNDQKFKWLQRESTPSYLDINVHPKMVNRKFTEHVEFWNEIFANTASDSSLKDEL